jgi:hypothetical protein
MRYWSGRTGPVAEELAGPCVDLHGRGLDDASALALVDEARAAGGARVRPLTHLSLGYNRLTPYGASSIVQYCASDDLVGLDVSGSRWSEADPEESTRRLVLWTSDDGEERPLRLETLNLAYCQIDHVTVERVLSTACVCSGLQCLDLSRNHLGDEGVLFVFRASRSLFPEMRRLLLSGTGLTAEGCAMMGKEMKEASPGVWKLSALDLSGNFIGDEGLAFLLEGLRAGGGGPWIRSLSVDSCGLGDDGAVALAGLLEGAVKPCLVELSLVSNSVRERGLTSLVHALGTALGGRTRRIKLPLQLPAAALEELRLVISRGCTLESVFAGSRQTAALLLKDCDESSASVRELSSRRRLLTEWALATNH